MLSGLASANVFLYLAFGVWGPGILAQEVHGTSPTIFREGGGTLACHVDGPLESASRGEIARS